MTSDKARKRKVRHRMRTLGIPYAEAVRQLSSPPGPLPGHDGHQAEDPSDAGWLDAVELLTSAQQDLYFASYALATNGRTPEQVLQGYAGHGADPRDIVAVYQVMRTHPQPQQDNR